MVRLLELDAPLLQALRLLELDAPLLQALQQAIVGADDSGKTVNAPTRAYAVDAKAMAAMPADVKEHPNSYVFIVAMPGLKSEVQHVIDGADDSVKTVNAPTRTYDVLDHKAMAATPADVKEYPNSYVFIVDMPGLKSEDIKVQVERVNVLIISGERKREEEKEAEGAKYLTTERRVGKFTREFVLPQNANTDAISAVCQYGVLTVTVQKKPPPPEPKKPKTIEVKITIGVNGA